MPAALASFILVFVRWTFDVPDWLMLDQPVSVESDLCTLLCPAIMCVPCHDYVSTFDVTPDTLCLDSVLSNWTTATTSVKVKQIQIGSRSGVVQTQPYPACIPCRMYWCSCKRPETLCKPLCEVCLVPLEYGCLVVAVAQREDVMSIGLIELSSSAYQ